MTHAPGLYSAVTWLMPRVNRDLQRRMAARRERERRRPPAERRYRFGTPETDLEADESLIESDAATVETPVEKRSRPPRENANTTQPVASTIRGGARPGATSFAAEYAYVLSDLRRVGLVIGSLLLILILLYFILPH
jgi:hypothetical protein